MQVRNSRLPIKDIELQQSGNWVKLQPQTFNYYVADTPIQAPVRTPSASPHKAASKWSKAALHCKLARRSAAPSSFSRPLHESAHGRFRPTVFASERPTLYRARRAFPIGWGNSLRTGKCCLFIANVGDLRNGFASEGLG